MKILILGLIVASVFAQIEIPIKQRNNLGAIDKNMTNFGGLQYYAEMILGGQNFTFLFDTASAVSWIPVTGCVGCLKNTYNATNSSTAVIKEDRLSSHIGHVKVEGFEMTELFKLFDKSKNVRLPFIGVDKMQNGRVLQGDGVVGLGREDEGFNSFLFEMSEAGVVKDRVYTFSFYNDENKTSTVTLGGYPKSLSTANLTWNHVVTHHDWSIHFRHIKVDGVETGTAAAKTAQFATSMTGISLPSSDFDHWWSNINTDARICGTVGDGKLPACYCDSIDEFPELSLAFYRFEYKIPAEVYILY